MYDVMSDRSTEVQCLMLWCYCGRVLPDCTAPLRHERLEVLFVYLTSFTLDCSVKHVIKASGNNLQLSVTHLECVAVNIAIGKGKTFLFPS